MLVGDADRYTQTLSSTQNTPLDRFYWLTIAGFDQRCITYIQNDGAAMVYKCR